MTKKEYLGNIGYKYYKGEDIYIQAFGNNNGDYLVIAYIDARFNDFYVVPDTIYSQKISILHKLFLITWKETLKKCKSMRSSYDITYFKNWRTIFC